MTMFPFNTSPRRETWLGQGHPAERKNPPCPVLAAFYHSCPRPLTGPSSLHLWQPLLPVSRSRLRQLSLSLLCSEKVPGALLGFQLCWAHWLGNESDPVPAQGAPNPVGKTKQITNGPLVESFHLATVNSLESKQHGCLLKGRENDAQKSRRMTTQVLFGNYQEGKKKAQARCV